MLHLISWFRFPISCSKLEICSRTPTEIFRGFFFPQACSPAWRSLKANSFFVSSRSCYRMKWYSSLFIVTLHQILFWGEGNCGNCMDVCVCGMVDIAHAWKLIPFHAQVLLVPANCVQSRCKFTCKIMPVNSVNWDVIFRLFDIVLWILLLRWIILPQSSPDLN